MKQLISATLSKEAAAIYNNWEKQQKSKILSHIIVKEDSNRLQIEALQTQRRVTLSLLSAAMIKIQAEEGVSPLVERLNTMLEGTIHYQYWGYEMMKD